MTRKIAAREALDANAYAAAFQLSPFPSAFLARDATILSANGALAALLGYEPDDLVGLRLDNILAASAAGKAEGLVRDAMLWSEVTAEIAFQREDGGEVPVEASLSLFVTGSGQRLVHLSAHDARERIRRNRIYTTALSATRAANAAPSRDALASSVLQAIRSSVPELAAAAFYLVSPATGHLEVAAGFGVEPGWRERHGIVRLGSAEEETFLAHACRTRESLVVFDTGLEPPQHETGMPTDATSLLAVPAIGGDRLLGGILAAARHGQRLDLEDLQAVEVAASEAANALLRLEISEHLAAAETRYRALMESVADGIVVADEEGHILEANPAALTLLGWSEGMPHTIFDLPTESRHEREQFVVALYEQGHATGYFDVETPRRLRRLRVRASRAPGRPVRLILFVEDATAEGRADRLRLFTSALDAVAVNAPPGPLPAAAFAEAARSALGAAAVAFLVPAHGGLHAAARVGPLASHLDLTARTVDAALQEALARRRAIIAPTEDSRLKGMRIVKVIPAFEGDALLGALVVGHDRAHPTLLGQEDSPWLDLASDELARVIRHHRNNEQVRASLRRERESHEHARRLNDEINEFTLWTTHDLREPLRSLATLAAFLEDDIDRMTPEEARDLAGKIRRAGDRLKDRILALHSFSLLVRDEEAPLQEVNLGDVARTVTALLDSLIKERGATVVVEGDLPTVLGHAGRLDLVLLNLVENAIKYGDPASPTVRIAAEEDAVAVELAVEDNGQGVPEGVREKVFHLFYRNPSHTNIPGSGTGLAIVQRIAAQHGGSARVEPSSMGGARFVVRLPKRSA